MQKCSILFVCLGNICRSPMAEAIANHLAEERQLSRYISCDSAGTSDYHIGGLPDQRVMTLLERKGMSSSHRARQFVSTDSGHFTYILAMDSSNYKDIRAMASTSLSNLSLIRDYDPEDKGADVPDPYFGGQEGFEEVYTMLSRSISNFFDLLPN